MQRFVHPEQKDDIPRAYCEGSQDDLEEAWSAVTLMEATSWRFLPYAGGLLDQPELLLSNIFRIKAVINAVREMDK